MSVLDEADAYASPATASTFPEDPDARRIEPDPECVTDPDFGAGPGPAAGVTAIVWATGFAVDYSWLKVDAFDEKRRGRSTSVASRPNPGSISSGFPWLSRRGSSFIWGVWHDAKHLADHIATQRKYLTYRDDRRPASGAEPEDPAR